MGNALDGFTPVDTYARLSQYGNAWKNGEITNLCIVGRGGIGKTHLYESMDMRNYHLFRGKTSAISMFKQVCDAPHLPIVFDDIRALLKDPSCLDLLKQLADTRPTRRIRWRTMTRELDAHEFDCTSPILIVLNWVPKEDSDVAAIIDRFICLHFQPTKAEICDVMRTFCKDPADVDLIETLAVDVTLRDLVKFEQMKASPSINHIAELMATCAIPKGIQQIMEVLQNVKWGNKLKAFHNLYGGNEATAKKYWDRNKATAERLLPPSPKPRRKPRRKAKAKTATKQPKPRNRKVTKPIFDA